MIVLSYITTLWEISSAFVQMLSPRINWILIMFQDWATLSIHTPTLSRLNISSNCITTKNTAALSVDLPLSFCFWKLFTNQWYITLQTHKHCAVILVSDNLSKSLPGTLEQKLYIWKGCGQSLSNHHKYIIIGEFKPISCTTTWTWSEWYMSMSLYAQHQLHNHPVITQG